MRTHCSTQIRAIGHIRLVETLSRLYCLGVIRQNAVLQYVAIHYAYADSKLIRVTLVSIEWRLFHKQIVGQNDTEEGELQTRRTSQGHKIIVLWD